MLALAGGDTGRIDGRILIQAARQGDVVAQQVVEKVAGYLGLGLVNIMMLLLPEGIVMGGGVMEEFDLFAPGIRRMIERHNVLLPVEQVKVLKMQLGAQSGVLGAARAILNILEEPSS